MTSATIARWCELAVVTGGSTPQAKRVNRKSSLRRDADPTRMPRFFWLPCGRARAIIERFLRLEHHRRG
jgi:hypothetical protein